MQCNAMQCNVCLSLSLIHSSVFLFSFAHTDVRTSEISEIHCMFVCVYIYTCVNDTEREQERKKSERETYMWSGAYVPHLNLSCTC